METNLSPRAVEAVDRWNCDRLQNRDVHAFVDECARLDAALSIVTAERDRMRVALEAALDFQIANRGIPDAVEFYRTYTWPHGEMPPWVHSARLALEPKP